MNVLILNMSKLPGSNEIRPSIYVVKEELAKLFSYENWNQEIGYRSQMEPVPMFLIDMLEKKGEHLNTIVVLNTRKTLEKRIVEIDQKAREESAYELFKRQISQYCKGKNCYIPQYVSIVFDAEIGEHSTDVEVLQANMRAITEAVKFLRMEKSKTDQFHLWLDMHGGLRNTAYLNAAILNLLKTEHIYPKMCLTANPIGEHKFRVEKDDLSQLTLDFTAAMQAFLIYGEAEGLKNNIDDNGIFNGTSSQRFMNIVYDISEAIKICDVSAFEEGILALRDELSRGNTYEGIIEIFKNTIQDSFGSLLREETNTFNELQWCVDKGYFQQAMVLLEAHMSEYLYFTFFDDRSIFYIDGVYLTKEDLSDDQRKTIKKVFNGREWESLECKLFNKWADANALISYIEAGIDGNSILGVDLKKEKLITKRIHENKKENEADVEFIKRLIKYKNPYLLDEEDTDESKDHLPMNSVVYGNNIEMYVDPYYSGDLEQLTKKKCIWIRLELKNPHDSDWRRRLQQFLYLHYILVEYRNKMMHAVRGKRIPTEVIREDLLCYTELMAGLLR